MDIRAEIKSGPCGFVSCIKASSNDGENVTLHIESDCSMVQKMVGTLHSLNAIEEVLRKSLIETTPAHLAAKYKLHPTCLVPVGILRAVEAAAGLALPARCEIELFREEER